MKKDKYSSQLKVNNKKKTYNLDSSQQYSDENQQKLQENQSLSKRVFNALDQLSKQLNSSQSKMLNENKINELKEVIGQVELKMTVEEMYELEYCNRLHYIQKTFQRRNFKHKNQLLSLQKIISGEIERVEKEFLLYFQNIDSLLSLKTKYQFCMFSQNS